MDGIESIAAERKRQIEAEGWTAEHDDEHRSGELASAGSAYAMSAAVTLKTGIEGIVSEPPPFFKFEPKFWKPKSAREDLVRGGALIAAEIDRLDRQEARDEAQMPGGDSGAQ